MIIILYQTKQDRVGKVIHRELYKKFKFDHTARCYVHKQESILENETDKLLWDFETQTDHLISARQPGLVTVNNNNHKKRNCRIVGFVVPVDRKMKIKENENTDKYLDLAENFLKSMKVTVISVVIGALGMIPNGLVKRLEGFSLAVTQTPERNYQLTLV